MLSFPGGSWREAQAWLLGAEEAGVKLRPFSEGPGPDWGQGLYVHVFSTHWTPGQAARAFASTVPAARATLPSMELIPAPSALSPEDTASRNPPRFSGLGQAPRSGLARSLNFPISPLITQYYSWAISRLLSQLTPTDRVFSRHQAHTVQV